jgi:prepilin signal peptidase PulO-like enzyme (type II secretory pathway)
MFRQLAKGDGLWKIILWCAVITMLLKIAYLDYKYHYIADRDILLGTVPALTLQYLYHSLFNGFFGLVLGGFCAGLVYCLARWKYGYAAFGSGDVTLFFLSWEHCGKTGLCRVGNFFLSLIFALLGSPSPSQKVVLGQGLSTCSLP